MKTFLVVLVVSIIFVGVAILSWRAFRYLSVPNEAAYAEGFALYPGTSVQLPDFKLTYVGDSQERLPPPVDRSITHQEYIVEGAHGRTNFSWSSGLGELGATSFEYNGKKYYLNVAAPPSFEQTKKIVSDRHWVYPADYLEDSKQK